MAGGEHGHWGMHGGGGGGWECGGNMVGGLGWGYGGVHGNVLGTCVVRLCGIVVGEGHEQLKCSIY